MVHPFAVDPDKSGECLTCRRPEEDPAHPRAASPGEWLLARFERACVEGARVGEVEGDRVLWSKALVEAARHGWQQ